jgi:hypothetical protein
MASGEIKPLPIINSGIAGITGLTGGWAGGNCLFQAGIAFSGEFTASWNVSCVGATAGVSLTCGEAAHEKKIAAKTEQSQIEGYAFIAIMVFIGLFFNIFHGFYNLLKHFSSLCRIWVWNTVMKKPC